MMIIMMVAMMMMMMRMMTQVDMSKMDIPPALLMKSNEHEISREEETTVILQVCYHDENDDNDENDDDDNDDNDNDDNDNDDNDDDDNDDDKVFGGEERESSAS